MTTTGLHDIADRDDIFALVEEFYTRAFRDELIGPVFVDVAKMDLQAHMPTMCDFWETVLFGARTYRGGAFVPHAELHEKVPLTRQHFDRWMATWRGTVDSMYAGPVAERAKDRAARIADAFHGRLVQPEVGPMCLYRYAGPRADA